jgi:cytochrome oxidase assembly protein ShyY1
MYRFLLTPKWILGHVLLVVTLVLFVAAGFWQLRRLDEVRADRLLSEERLDVEPVALDRLVADTAGDPAELAYRRVEVTGEYRTGQQVATIPLSRGGRPGNLLLTPLEPAGSATTVLVERGWVPYDREGVPTEAAAPPQGEVTVEGVLLPAQGDGTREVFNDLGMVTLIDPPVMEDDLGLALQPLHLRLLEQQPAQEGALPVAGELPQLDEGNHRSYAVQWFLFSGIALIGYPILVVKTARERAAGEPMMQPTGGRV